MLNLSNNSELCQKKFDALSIDLELVYQEIKKTPQQDEKKKLLYDKVYNILYTISSEFQNKKSVIEKSLMGRFSTSPSQLSKTFSSIRNTAFLMGNELSFNDDYYDECDDFKSLNKLMLIYLDSIASHAPENFRAKAIEIAKLCAQIDVNKSIEYIKKFKIKDQNTLYEIAMHCAENDTQQTVRRINEFEITSQESLVKIAKLCAQKNGKLTAQLIKSFGIEDENKRIEIAKLCIPTNARDFPQLLNNFEIKDEGALYDLAKLCANENAWGVALYINVFGIKTEEKLVEIAKLCAVKDGWTVASYINGFGIKNEIDRIEIAKLCLAQNPQKTAQFFKNFNIQIKEALTEIAFFCADKDPETFMLNFQKFGNIDEQSKVHILKLCAQKSERTVQYLKNFDIKNEQDRIEIANICALHYPASAATFFRNFAIHSQEAAVHIAKQCARLDGEKTAECIKNFQIEDQGALSEVASLCLETNSRMVKFFSNFGINDQKISFNFAARCADKDPAIAVQFFKSFGLTEESSRNEIAKLCAQKVPLTTLQLFRNFDIQDQDLLLKLAKLSARAEGIKTAEIIKNFKINDPDQRREIFSLCVQQGGWSVVAFLPNFELHDDITLELQNCWSIIKNTPISCEKLLFSLKNWNERSFAHTKFLGILEEIEKTPNQQIQSQKLSLLAESFLMMDFTLTKEQVDWIDQQKLLPSIINFSRPDMRQSILKILINTAKNSEALNFFSSFIVEREVKKNRTNIEGAQKKELAPWIQLERLLLSSLCMDGMSDKIAKKLLKKTAGRKLSIFYNGIHQSILIEMLIKLKEFNKISVKEKDAVLEKIFNETLEKAVINSENQFQSKEKNKILLQENQAEKAKLELILSEKLLKLVNESINLEEKKSKLTEIFDNTKLEAKKKLFNQCYNNQIKNVDELNEKIKSFVNSFASKENELQRRALVKAAGKEKYLQRVYEPLLAQKIQVVLSLLIFDEPQSLKEFNSTLENVLQSLIFKSLPIAEVEDFAEKYLKNFGSRRNPSALPTYVAKIVSLKDPAALKCLGNFVCAVLDGNFEKIRNSLDHNPHLRTIAKASNDPDLLSKWHQSLPAKKISDSLFLVDSHDPMDLFLCGTEIDSCQSVTGSPFLNKGLLGYTMDGKNRLLAIKDSEGRIAARCLLRILWDGEKPVLYRDILYPTALPHDHLIALNQMALKKAEILNLDLVANVKDGIPYHKNLISLGGPAPWEYCNLAEGTYGIKAEGKFILPKSVCTHLKDADMVEVVSN